ncbi:MAG: amidohydrolase, partial [Paenibacillus sp.]|nr:amidohydrolase [Paenibacillus sp.]
TIFMSQATALQPLLAAGKRMESELVEFRRDLHRNPELSMQESETAAKVAERLSAMGFEIKTGVGGHGIVADLAGGKPGKTIALRADMDALPIEEESGEPFASQRPGVMHACGHDAHTTMLLGAARILMEQKEHIQGTVRFLFQSAEEINRGARLMIEEGALDVAASAIVMGLQTAVSREISPFDPVVVTVGSLQAGDTYNVIPHRASMVGTIRTFAPHVQATMKERITRIAGQIAEAYRCKAEVEYTEMTPVLVSADDSVAHVERTVEAAIGADNRIEAAPTLAGEDFSLYLQKVPGCFFWLGSGPREGAERAYGLHHPKFRIEEECLPLGASLLAAVALNRLT